MKLKRVREICRMRSHNTVELCPILKLILREGEIAQWLKVLAVQLRCQHQHQAIHKCLSSSSKQAIQCSSVASLGTHMCVFTHIHCVQAHQTYK